MENKIRGAENLDMKSASRHIKELALRGSAAMVLSRSTSTMVQFASSIVLARSLEPNDFGLFAMVTAFSLLLANVGHNGFIEAIVQADEINHQQVSALFWIGFGISLGLAILFSVFSPLLANLYKEQRLVSIAVALSIGFIFNALTTTPLALIMRRIEFHKVMLNEIISVVVSNAIAVVMAFSGFGYWALVVRQLASMLLSAVIAWIQCPWRPSLPRKTSRMKRSIKYAASTFGNYGIGYMGRNLDKVLIGWRWGPQELGNYDRSYQLFVMPVGQMVIPLERVALATLSRLQNDPEKYRRYFLRSLSIIAFVGMLMSAIFTVAGQDIIIFLLGKQWAKAGQIFTAFGPSIGITLIYGTHSWLHLSLGRPARMLRWSLAALAVTALMFVIGLKFGGLGIAMTYSFSFYLLVGPALVYAGRPIGIRPKHIWEQLWRYYVAFVLSGSVVWIVLVRGTIFGFPTGGFPLLLKILTVSVACAVLYLLAVLALYRNDQPFKDLVMVIREVVPWRKPISESATNGTL